MTYDASDQIINSKSDMANMVRVLTMQRDFLRAEMERLHHDFTMADAAVKNQRETVQKWQAEVTALRAEVTANDRQWAHQCEEINRLRARIAELEAELAAMKHNLSKHKAMARVRKR